MRPKSGLEAFQELRRQTPFGRSKLDQEVNLAHAWNYCRNYFANSNGWTPTSEGLPWRPGIYYVTLASGDVGTSAFYVGSFDRSILAWMPYPAPYRTEGSAEAEGQKDE